MQIALIIRISSLPLICYQKQLFKTFPVFLNLGGVFFVMYEATQQQHMKKLN